jgi:predicted transcriptional regulator
MQRKKNYGFSPIRQYVIDAVRCKRKEKGISQKTLAAWLCVGRTFIANIENPKHPAAYNLPQLNAIAYFMDEPLHRFLPEKFLDVKEEEG